MTQSQDRTTVADIQAALRLPDGALVNQRVPKKLLADRGAPTAADRKLIHEHIENVQWIAALKPTNVGIASFADAVREYLEVSVLSIELRDTDCLSVKAKRIAELAHRAIPYPVLIVMDDGANVALSLSHMRRAQDGTANTVLDGAHGWALFPATDIPTGEPPATARQQALAALRVGRQAWATLWHLYQAWIEVVIAWQAVPLTGCFVLPSSAEHAAATRQAVHRIGELQQQIESLRRAAAKERQIARLAEANQAIKQIQRDIETERAKLRGQPS